MANLAQHPAELLPMSDGLELTDEQLMEALDAGDDHALAGLVERYQTDIFRFCLHYLKNVESAKEMAQETFLRIYTARSRFEVNRKFKPWMLCIARNLCLNEIKCKWRRSKNMRAYPGMNPGMCCEIPMIVPMKSC